MFQSTPSALQPASTQASTSTNPNAVVPASYHPQPRPIPMPPFERIDTQAIKQELHDVLGEHGLPYWKTVNGYLLGQVGRGELMEMAKIWLKGDAAQLHNRLLVSLLYNASASPGSASLRKRKYVGPEDAEFDVDETYIEPKGRVRSWASGLTGTDIKRIRRQLAGRVEEREDAVGMEMSKRTWPSFQPDTMMPPLSVSSRQLPSSLQLSHRLAQLCKAYNLNIGSDTNDIGDFMAVGMDAHLGDVLHQLVHLTGKERQGNETVRIPKGIKQEAMEVDEVKTEEGEIPKPDLETLQTLFALDPKLHPSASSSVYKLITSHTITEAELHRPVKKEEKLPSSPAMNGLIAPPLEGVAKRLVDGGLLKLDKGRQSEAAEEGGKKDKKHSLHWKYEDPAIILKDVLG